MYDFSQWLFGNGGAGAGGGANPAGNNQMNLMPPQAKNPLASMTMPGQNLGFPNPSPAPAYAQGAGIAQAGAPGALPNRSTPPGTPTAGAGGDAAGGQSDSLRKMMLMQYLMGGEGGEPMNPISGGQAGGEGLKGSGGFQNDPRAGLLNSFPPQMPRRSFLGSGG